jgi:pimeloyl-ACP methyl ester carboxylesterase
MPQGIIYYVDVFMLLAKHAGLAKFHAFGHHSGASMATEMAAVYPSSIVSLTIVGPVLMTREEQITHSEGLLEYDTRPVIDGSHWMKVWNILLMQKQGEWDVLKMNGEALDWVRAWEGKVQCYTNGFSWPMMKLLREVKCPMLGMSSEKDILFEFFPRLKEIISSVKCLLRFV